MIKLNNKNKLITIVLVIALMVAGLGVITFANSLNVSTLAETVGVNGVVDNPNSDYQNRTGVHVISNETQFNAFLNAEGSETAPIYGYLANDITITTNPGNRIVQYHNLDGCGKKITINSSSGSITDTTLLANEKTAIAVDSYNGTYAWLSSDSTRDTIRNCGVLYQDSGGTCPFGYDSRKEGFYTTGYLGAIGFKLNFFSIKFEYNGTFAVSHNDCYRGISFGVLFGYVIESEFDNCSLDFKGKVLVKNYNGQKPGVGDGYQGVGTVALGGYAGVMDLASVITNSEIILNDGSYISGFCKGKDSKNYPRVFVGGITGCLVNGSMAFNIRASGNGNLRAWGEAGLNRCGLAGIITGTMIGCPSLYTPLNTGNGSNVSKLSGGVINGVICSWTGIAATYSDSNQYLFMSNKGDTFFHRKNLNGTLQVGNAEHFYGGALAGAAEGSNVTNVFYTFERETMLRITFDRYRETRASEGYDPAANSNSVGFGPITFYSGSQAGASHIILKVENEQTRAYEYATGTYTGATYNNNTKETYIVGDEQGSYPIISNTFVSSGVVSNIRTDILNLEWSAPDASPVQVSCNATTGEASDNSGRIAWSIIIGEIGQPGEERMLYDKVNNIEDAISQYSKYGYSGFVARNSAGVNLEIKVKFGYVAKYKLNDADDYEVDGGNKEYDTLSNYAVQNIILQTLVRDADGKIIKDAGVNRVGNFKYNTLISGLSESSGKTLYNNPNIWAVFKELDLNAYGISEIKDAGVYEIKVYKADDPRGIYDFADFDNRIVAYKADNAHKPAGTIPAGGTWQPKVVYTINQVLLNGSWGETPDVDGDYIYNGSNFPFTYTLDKSNLKGSDLCDLPMMYYQIYYKDVDREDLEIGEDYYKLNNNGTYSLVGTFDGEEDFGEGIEKFYMQQLVRTESVQNSGFYEIRLGDLTNKNYKISSSVTKVYNNLYVKPREIEMEFKNVDSIVYNTREQKVSYIILDTNTNIVGKSDDSVTISNANIIIKNVFELTALEITLDPGETKFIDAGVYYVNIALGSGSATKNYLLSSDESKYDISAQEVFNDVLSFTIRAGKVSRVTRNIVINKADVELLRKVDSNGTFEDREFADQYKLLTDVYNVSSMVNMSLKVYDSENNPSLKEISVYKDKDPYEGYNSIQCMIKGVSLGGKSFDEIYCNFEYYEATLDKTVNPNVYRADSKDTLGGVVDSIGTYIVKISFMEDVYVNYNNQDFYMVYEVEGVNAYINIDHTRVTATQEYNAEEVTFNNIATVTGVLDVDMRPPRSMGVIMRYAVKVDVAADYVIDGDNYALLPLNEKPRDAGSYVVIVDNNIDLTSYILNLNFTGDSSDSVELNDKMCPFVRFEITKIALSVTVSQAYTKVYATEYEGSIGYSWGGSNTLIEGDSVSLRLVSDGFAIDADVDEYGYDAILSGPSAKNYTIAEVAEKFNVTPKALTYNVQGTNTYGNTLDASNVSITLAQGITLYGSDEVIPSVSSQGLTATANVGSYNVTISITGADAGNYTATANGQIKVNPRVLTLESVTAPVSLEYSAEEKQVVATFNGIVNDDEVNAVVLYNGNKTVKPINVGHYRALVTGVDNTNYTYSTSAVYDVEFDITPISISISVGAITIGYGDTSITSDSIAYTVDSGAFLGDDATKVRYLPVDATTKEEDESILLGDCGTYEGVIALSVDEDILANYNITVNTYGDLTIGKKNLSTMKLKKNSVEYTGSNLRNEIVLDTNGTGWTIDSITFGGHSVDEIINIGTYKVNISAEEDDTNYVGSVVLNFVVTKAHIKSLSASDFTIRYNQIAISGRYEGIDSQIGLSATTLVDGSSISNLTGATQYKLYVMFAESELYYATEEPLTITLSTTIDPTVINGHLQDFKEHDFSFYFIHDYKHVMEDITKLSDLDRELVDFDYLEEITRQYENLLNNAAKAINVVRGTTTSSSSQSKAALALSFTSGSLIAAGIALCLRKKEKKVEYKGIGNMKRKILLVIIVCVIITSLMFSIIACDKDVKKPDQPKPDQPKPDQPKPDQPPVEGDVNEILLTDVEILETAAAFVKTNPRISIEIRGINGTLIYELEKSGQEYIHPDLEGLVDPASYSSIRRIYSLEKSAFSNIQVSNVADEDKNVLTARIASPIRYFGFEEINDSVSVLDTGVEIKAVVAPTKSIVYIHYTYRVRVNADAFTVEIDIAK